MNTTINPFSYNSHNTSGYNYKRLDPSTFWNPSINFVKRTKKKKLNSNDETFKKVVRNVKTLPEHLIGRFKHNKENSRKTKARYCNINFSNHEIKFRMLYSLAEVGMVLL